MTTPAPSPCCPGCAARASELAALRADMDALRGQVEAFRRSVLRLDESTGDAMAAAARRARPAGVGRTVLTVVRDGAA